MEMLLGFIMAAFLFICFPPSVDSMHVRFLKVKIFNANNQDVKEIIVYQINGFNYPNSGKQLGCITLPSTEHDVIAGCLEGCLKWKGEKCMSVNIPSVGMEPTQCCFRSKGQDGKPTKADNGYHLALPEHNGLQDSGRIEIEQIGGGGEDDNSSGSGLARM